MEQPAGRDRSDEMEGRLERLGDHIDDAEQHLDEIRPDADVENATGDFEDTHTHGGGEDPVGARDDAVHGDNADGMVDEEQAGPP
jgi:hypothetical protein